MKLSLGFSPCPNDTFIFDGMIHGKIDTEGLEFDVKLGDVEELNQGAFKHELDITKLSYHAFAFVMEDYVLLNSGSALGNNCGPLLIAKQPLSDEEIIQGKIAIPGKYTTANFLLSIAYPKAAHKTEFLFSDIEQAVLDKKVDAGLIIHENRFTYADKGLVKIIDLGEYWENTFQLPIPLGGIVIKRSLEKSIQEKVDRVLKRSVEFARQNPAQTMDYVAQYAQEMDPKVMRAHINLYVNEFTEDLGNKGKAAIRHLIETGVQKGVLKPINKEIFV